jgi:lipoprotein-releasing system permease protein
MSFELLIASRYLRTQRRSQLIDRLRWGTLGLILTTAAVFAGDQLVDHYLRDHLSQFLWDLRSVFRTLKYATVLLTVLFGFFVELIRKLTIFSTISTFGLFLGTGALVTVLSVMSGFEQDLKGKILGTHAHMIVTTPDRSFVDYREALEAVEKDDGVVAATPYLSDEVMLTSQSNLAGVILKGIDPKTIGRVTDLVKNTDQGSLDNLLYPERLRMVQDTPAGKLIQPAPEPPPPDAGPLDAAPLAEAKPSQPTTPPTHDAPAPPTAKKTGDQAPDTQAVAAKPAEKAEDEKADEEKIAAKPARPKRVLPGVVIGRELAKNLRVYVGDDVSVVSPLGDVGPTGPIPKSRPFRVVGIFFSGMYEYDSKYVYMLLPTAQKFLGVEDEVTGIELKLKNPEETEPVIARVQKTLTIAAPRGGFEVDDWKHLNLSLFSALKLEKIAMFIALCFIILVAASSIVSNGIMLVLEKGREIAILKSMGASNGSVLRVFVYLGLYMGMLGTTLGVLVGCATCWAFDRFGLPLDTEVYYITKLPVKVDPSELFAVLGAALALSLGATLYPAWMAARLRPVEALR